MCSPVLLSSSRAGIWGCDHQDPGPHISLLCFQICCFKPDLCIFKKLPPVLQSGAFRAVVVPWK